MCDDDYEMTESFGIGELSGLDGTPDRDLLSVMGDQAGAYEFSFYEAPVIRDSDGASTLSYIEIAHSKQLGGAYVVWFSGVSALDAARSCSYGWIGCPCLAADFSDALFRRSLVQGEPIIGHYRNTEEYYENRIR